jgi:hypothetical protein
MIALDRQKILDAAAQRIQGMEDFSELLQDAARMEEMGQVVLDYLNRARIAWTQMEGEGHEQMPKDIRDVMRMGLESNAHAVQPHLKALAKYAGKAK